jgi:hypothetical protein
MAETSYPFEGANTTEAQYSQLFRRLNFTGIAGAPGDSTVKVTGDSSGMNVKVSAGYAMVRGHFYKTDAISTLTITAANGSNPRKDLIVLRLDPTTANSIVLTVKTGTAGASPSDPSLTQTDEGVFEFPIARVNVAAGASTISAGNVEDLRQFMGAPFGRWASNALRPTVTSSDIVVGWNSGTGIIEFWNGTAWAEAKPSTITAALMSDPENLAAGKLRSGGVSGGTQFRVFVQSGTPTGAASGDLWFW